ncbi:serine/threonine protein phosphatase [Candidatus Acetothermia bacterium]|jgi:predicted MPP superfamily phosphohydrolase|nr:serine/threonine protein phosphatase [Candidatus Acetothermia bacterium]MCI2432262.1 serine/threonine protein phosphatase [Candidatus Acetothermia bacterium]MCI2436518.1 serine/threonine protein phosphatase [Candidatus Acetothermia bacterium]
MDERTLLDAAADLFARQGRLIELASSGRAVFVGDTHGDLEASQIVIEHYLNSETTLVFLGDYVDRGAQSLENILFLLEQKLKHPENIFLLQGNHEGWKYTEFSPADFWQSLSEERRARFAETLALLPLAVATPNGVLAVHGGLPDVQTLSEINQIEPGSENWRAITWGDWQEVSGSYLEDQGSRPQYGEAHFREIMRRLNKKILIRGHQPHAPRYLFDKRCLTLFTSSAYPVPRTVAISDLAQPIQKADQLTINTL